VPMLPLASAVSLPGDGRFELRAYEPRDKKAVGILRAVAHHEEPTPEWEKPPSDALPHHTVVVAEVQEGEARGRVVAAARIIVTEPHLAHLQFMCVEEGLRGRGLGSALLRWVDLTSRDACGARHVELEVGPMNPKPYTLNRSILYILKL